MNNRQARKLRLYASRGIRGQWDRALEARPWWLPAWIWRAVVRRVVSAVLEEEG